MFSGYDTARVASMTQQEKRWLDNIKKAFHDSDLSFVGGAIEDRCLEETFKAIDTSKTLRRSLRNEDVSHHGNRRKFIEFLGLEIPMAHLDGPKIEAVHPVTGVKRALSYGEVIYDIRCMIHENENLNVAEGVQHDIAIDWQVPDFYMPWEVARGQIVCNGRFMWRRLREVLAKFITGLEGMVAIENQESFTMTIRPEIGAVVPLKRQGRSVR